MATTQEAITEEALPPELTAVALRYDKARDRATKIVAAGKGFTGEQIVALAKAHNVPLREDPALAGVLADLHLGKDIPPELYRAVAEVLTWVYRLQPRKR